MRRYKRTKLSQRKIRRKNRKGRGSRARREEQIVLQVYLYAQSKE